MKQVNAVLGGGLGNKLFVYAFARAYAERHGFDLRCQGCLYPVSWNQVFDLESRPIERDLPHRESFRFEEWDGEGDITITGLCQHQKNLIYTRAKVREWFQLKPEMAALVQDVPSLPLVASLRNGDYTYACNPFVWISRQAYVNACHEHGLDAALLYWLDSEEHYRIPQIPVSGSWFNLPWPEREKSIEFLPDLALMMRAKVLLRSNSTFAWWAASLGTARVFCPDVSKVDPAAAVMGGIRYAQVVPFVEGNHPPMVAGYDYLSDLHLPETT